MVSETSLPLFEFSDDGDNQRQNVELSKHVSELHKALHKHAHSYYVLDEPSIPDVEYDKLFAELQSIETAHPELRLQDSPTQRVGGKTLAQFATVRHRR
jgi:DNA ligase (NAD+)